LANRPHYSASFCRETSFSNLSSPGGAIQRPCRTGSFTTAGARSLLYPNRGLMPPAALCPLLQGSAQPRSRCPKMEFRDRKQLSRRSRSLIMAMAIACQAARSCETPIFQITLLRSQTSGAEEQRGIGAKGARLGWVSRARGWKCRLGPLTPLFRCPSSRIERRRRKAISPQLVAQFLRRLSRWAAGGRALGPDWTWADTAASEV